MIYASPNYRTRALLPKMRHKKFLFKPLDSYFFFDYNVTLETNIFFFARLSAIHPSVEKNPNVHTVRNFVFFLN